MNPLLPLAYFISLNILFFGTLKDVFIKLCSWFMLHFELGKFFSTIFMENYPVISCEIEKKVFWRTCGTLTKCGISCTSDFKNFQGNEVIKSYFILMSVFDATLFLSFTNWYQLLNIRLNVSFGIYLFHLLFGM